MSGSSLGRGLLANVRHRSVQAARWSIAINTKSPAVARRVSISTSRNVLERALEAENAADIALLLGAVPVPRQIIANDVLIVDLGRDRKAGDHVMSRWRSTTMVPAKGLSGYYPPALLRK